MLLGVNIIKAQLDPFKLDITLTGWSYSFQMSGENFRISKKGIFTNKTLYTVKEIQLVIDTPVEDLVKLDPRLAPLIKRKLELYG